MYTNINKWSHVYVESHARVLDEVYSQNANFLVIALDPSLMLSAITFPRSYRPCTMVATNHLNLQGIYAN